MNDMAMHLAAQPSAIKSRRRGGVPLELLG